MRRCPTCGASSPGDDRFCEVDGAELLETTPEPRPCPHCHEGTVEADGYCTACGRLAMPGTAGGPSLAGRALAGGVVVSSRAVDEHVVRLEGGALAIVALGEKAALDREADALEKLGGGRPFPRVLCRGSDPEHGPFLAVAMPPMEARPVSEIGPRSSLSVVAAVVVALVEAAQAVERLGLSWEPQRDDVFLEPDGAIHLARLRVPRRLAPRERLDARGVVEAVGPTFVPEPSLEGSPRAFRLLLPHVTLPGDAGATVEDVRGELGAIEREASPPPDDGSGVAGVCHAGLRRAHNEDAMASARGVSAGEPWAVLVVCDGVSSSSNADQASALASKTSCDALTHYARVGDVSFEATTAAVATAIRAAHVAVCAQGIAVQGPEPPGTTIVVGFVWRNRLTVGWVGDSRAYWVGDHGAELLTHDHSWAIEAVERGEVTEAEALSSPLAHALTRCLGPLESDDPSHPDHRIDEVEPSVRTRDLPGPGWVILCSDGFWNYFSSAAEVARLVRSVGDVPSPALLARRLVNHALARGGQDNTTVLVHRHG